MIDPIAQFAAWFEEAKRVPSIRDANAVCLATATPEGSPSARMVLLKSFDANGFVFYTNLESRKGGELRDNPRAALCFYWEALGKQIRIEGRIEPVSTEEADAYFATRPRDSQIGAWASDQSRRMESRAAFLARIAAFAAKFLGRDVPRPPHWSGFRLVPDAIEFWKDAPFRLHEREFFKRAGGQWKLDALFP